MSTTHEMTGRVKAITGSRKRNFRFYAGSDTHCTNSYWDGGSKTSYEVVNIDTGARFIPSPGSYPWTTPNDYTLKAGEVLIETGHFCGKPATPAISCRADDEARVRHWLGIYLVAVAA